MKNIVFDLGGVVFARNMKECTEEFIQFFSFVRGPKMPLFWEEYDRGTWSLEKVVAYMAKERGCTEEYCRKTIQEAIDLQRAVKPTEQLIGDLKKAGYKLYVLSNMSKEFISFLRKIPVYRNFDGEVVSCEELTVKPEPKIYEILLQRYGLNPQETLFIDDRQSNVDAAEQMGIHGFKFDAHSPETSCEELRKQLLDHQEK